MQKILIAEDNPIMADVLRFNLERAGFNVLVARSGFAAVELVDREQFDLIITDYQMPNVSGEELCRHIRDDSRNVMTPVLMITAKSYELESNQLIEELNIHNILPKPFSPREVVKIVSGVLEPSMA